MGTGPDKYGALTNIIVRSTSTLGLRAGTATHLREIKHGGDFKLYSIFYKLCFWIRLPYLDHTLEVDIH